MSAGAFNALTAPQAPGQQQQQLPPFVRYLRALGEVPLHHAPMQTVRASQLVYPTTQPAAPVTIAPWQPPQTRFAGTAPMNNLLAMGADRVANPNDPNLNMMSLMMGMQSPEQQAEEIPT